MPSILLDAWLTVSAEPPPPNLNRWLAVARPYLASALVDEPARSRLEDTARPLPADCLGIIEVRLSTDEPQVDLSVRLTSPEQARQLAWPHLQALLSRWAELGQVPTLWLEF